MKQHALERILLVIVVFVCLTVASCDDSADFVVAVHPFFTAQDIESDPGLGGTWVVKDEYELAFSFSLRKDAAYDVVLEENDGEAQQESRFEVHLVRLGATTFLDFFPVSLSEKSDFYKLHFVRCHAIARVEIHADTLELTFLNPDWLDHALKDNTVNVLHESVDGVLVLTAPTEELQDFLVLHANDDDAFHDHISLEIQFEQEHP